MLVATLRFWQPIRDVDFKTDSNSLLPSKNHSHNVVTNITLITKSSMLNGAQNLMLANRCERRIMEKLELFSSDRYLQFFKNHRGCLWRRFVEFCL